MCFNYALNTSIKSMEERFQAISIKKEFEPVYHAQAFIYPEMPVIVNYSQKKIEFFKWGLIPHWVTDDSKAVDLRKFTLNARGESIFEKPSFKNSIESKRCLIPASGFFEWQHINKEKIPHYIYVSDRKLISFAGIWSNYINDSGDEINTYSIITSEADDFMSKIHNTKKRMPVILNEDEEDIWLSKDLKENEIRHILRKKTHRFKSYTVNNSLGNPKVNSNVKEILDEVNRGTLNFGI